MSEESGDARGRSGSYEPDFGEGDSGGFDVLQTVRDRPLLALGAVFGAGVLLALVSRRGDDDGEETVEDLPVAVAAPDDPEARAMLWERRARRLQRLAREQEEELRSLRRQRGGAAAEEDDEADDEGDAGAEGGLTEIFRAGLQRIVRNAGRG